MAQGRSARLLQSKDLLSDFLPIVSCLESAERSMDGRTDGQNAASHMHAPSRFLRLTCKEREAIFPEWAQLGRPASMRYHSAVLSSCLFAPCTVCCSGTEAGILASKYHCKMLQDLAMFDGYIINLRRVCMPNGQPRKYQRSTHFKPWSEESTRNSTLNDIRCMPTFWCCE